MNKFHITHFHKIPVIACGGLVYEAFFTCKYKWSKGGVGLTKFYSKPYWECVSLLDVVVKCHNGEDIYESLTNEDQRRVDEQCIFISEASQPQDKPKGSRKKRS